MNWMKRGSALSIEEVIERNTGLDIETFLHPPSNVFIKGLQEAADMIMDSVVSGELITIYGDYDCDGITASAILFLTLVNLGHSNINVILPRRFTEGYGLSMAGVDRIDDGLLITIDNGITAVEQVAAAKEKGLKVVIIDHHLRREDNVIPEMADVIVDPNAIEGSDFSGYCGAGLAYKLACLMLDDKDVLEKLSALAAIGTVADVMPLVMDNRNIVIQGLENLNHGRNFPGVAALLERLELYEVTEGDIGFRLGPVLNAAGRMYDDGAMQAFNLLTRDRVYAKKAADEMVKINDERKEVVAKGIEYCERMIEDQCLYGESPLLLYTTCDDAYQLHEGVVGILAGRLAEKYKTPTIVLAETHDGILKGSGRSYGDIHLKSLLDTASDIIAGYGGHAGAAGLSVDKDRVEELREKLKESFEALDYHGEEGTDTAYFDLEVNAHQLPAVMAKLKRFAPYGEGNPQITFKVNNIRLVPRGGKFYRLMGNEGQHLKLFAQNFDAVGFDMAKRYREEQEPMCVHALGYVSENRFGHNTTLQIEMTDFQPKKVERKQSDLAMALAEKMKAKGLT